ncbi:RE2, partial [Symbiodinium necroappetens]
KNQIRMAARESFTRTANSEAIRRAELRQVRPSRGPFPVGTYVFYYDAASKQPGPDCWRGIARIVGREGQSTIWLSHRGILIAVSPEHLSLAHDEEVEQRTVVANEHSLVDAMPASGGSGFLDLRQAPRPPEEPERPNETEEKPDEEMPGLSEQGGSTTSVERQASERDARRMRKSSEFFGAKERERRARREPSLLPPPRPVESEPGQSSATPAATAREQAERDDAGLPPLEVPDYDPDLDEYEPERDDYRQARPALTRQLSPIVDDPAAEANEREAKRLRVTSGDEAAHMVTEHFSAFAAASTKNYLKEKAREHYRKHADFYEALAVTEGTFLFSCSRNRFDERYQALAATTAKKGRKEVRLNDLTPEQQNLFTKPGGSDEKEWKAWLGKGACEVLSLEASREIRRTKADLIIPTRWVRTNKNDNLFGAEFLAESRLVVQGFKDRALGQYRRDAPTASATAESICLAICANKRFLLFAKDIKNAYFSGKSMTREIYLEPPKGGLPDVAPGQLLQAKKAIYGFAEAARMFWLALKEHLQEDGWEESRLEPALFYYRVKQVLQGILVTHVDDLEGREVKQHESGNIDVMMRNYALSLKPVPVQRDRRQRLEDPLTEKEMELYQSSAGELGWLARQLRCDLAYENGVAQRANLDARVADLIRLKQFIGAARRGADFHLRFWADVSLKDSVVVHLSDAGHANGTPEHDEKMRYRSVGGYFILLANKGILEGKEVKANILAFNSGQTKRVCRSTLAAEASHLAEAVEAGDWIIVVLEEALTGKVDLRNWPEVIQQRQRVYVTDARSVFDYLQKDATSTSSDKRMAIEGALLRETVRQPGASVRWIDGQQNISDVLTKSGADKEGLKDFLRTGMLGLTQSEANRQLKAKQQEQRAQRKVVKRSNDEARQQQRKQQLQTTIQQLEPDLEDDAGDQPK